MLGNDGSEMRIEFRYITKSKNSTAFPKRKRKKVTRIVRLKVIPIPDPAFFFESKNR